MRVELNGEALELAADATLADAVAGLGIVIEPRGVAVALDGEVVPHGSWGATELAEGQRIEVVGAIQGG